jgi:hypothetical protein
MVSDGDDESFDSNEMRELLVGTWTGIALIADVIIQKGVVPRDEFIATLSDAEALAKDRRRVSLSALRKLIGYDFARPT